ncbi:hypothetical protein ACFX2I_020200 [Malus domestica]
MAPSVLVSSPFYLLCLKLGSMDFLMHLIETELKTSGLRIDLDHLGMVRGNKMDSVRSPRVLLLEVRMASGMALIKTLDFIF